MKRPESGGRSGAGAVLAGGTTGPRRLGPGEIQLWRVALDDVPEENVARLRAVLSPDEAERAQKFYFDRDRRRFSIGRGVLRHLLGAYLDCAPTEIRFRYGQNGKPELASPGGGSIHFNLAHSEGLALFAFTPVGEIGVDLEHLRELPDWEFIATTCFPPEDQAAVLQAPAALRLAEFFAAWTRQEARLKATGQGLGGEVHWSAVPPEDAGLRPGRRAAPRYTDGHNPAFRAFRPALRLYPLHVADGFAATLAIVGAARWATCWSWENEPEPERASRSNRGSHRVKLDQSANPRVEFP